MNEITVDALYSQMEGNFLTPDFAFADEEPIDNKTDSVEDLTVPYSHEDDDGINTSGEMSLDDFNKMMEEDDQDDYEDDASDLVEKDVNTFDDDEESYYVIDDKEYAAGEIKTAVKAMDDIKNFNAMKEHFREGMSKLADEFSRAEFIRMGEYDASIEHWTKQANEAKTNQEWQQAKYNLDLAVSRREAAKAGFEKYNRELQMGREEQERLENQQIINELIYSHNWQIDDFAEFNKYVNENGIQIKTGQASAGLLIALKKAALYDNQRKSKENELRQKAKVKPFTASPVNASNIDTIASRNTDGAKRKLEKRLAAGDKVDPVELFNNIVD
ncbi:TPA: hypothetical protein MBI04_003561 [Klebsiella pneumoniae]|nr:hypothetical protein [Klebsiella pneumoniae]